MYIHIYYGLGLLYVIGVCNIGAMLPNHEPAESLEDLVPLETSVSHAHNINT